MRRILVAEAPIGGAFWSGLGPVGVVRFVEDQIGKLAVCVRLRTALTSDGARVLPGEVIDIIGSGGRRKLGLPSHPPLGPHELLAGKTACDVSVVGHVARGRFPADEAVPLRVELGGDVRTVALVDAGDRIDVATTTVVTSDGAPGWLAPRLSRVGSEGDHLKWPESFEDQQSAPPALRFARPSTGAALVLATDHDLVRTQLGFGVHVRVDFLDDTFAWPQTRCDGILVRLDDGVVDWVFRAIVHDPSRGSEIERVCVAVTPGDGDAADLDPWLPHARFAWAMDLEEAIAAELPPDLDDEELLVARYATWDRGPCRAALPVEEVADVQVELERDARPRSEVLAEHDLDEYTWSLEERALGEALAESASDDIGTDLEDGAGPAPDRATARYAEALRTAREKAPTAPPPLERWAKVRAALEWRDPTRVVAEVGLTVAAFVAADRALEQSLDADETLRARFEGLLAEALGEEECAARARDDDDDDDEQPGEGAP